MLPRSLFPRPDEISENPPRAFRELTRFHIVLLLLSASMAPTGEIMLSTGAVEGVLSGDTAEWLVRGSVAIFFLYSLIVLLTVSERRIIRSVMKLRPQEADLAVSRALVITQILRSVQGVAIASAGIVASILTGNRFDLYTAIGFGLLLIVLTWPKRSRWESVFREASKEYPGVSASPW